MSDWYVEMTKAVRKREIAISGIQRWEEKRKAAEDLIAELSARRDQPDPAVNLNSVTAEAVGHISNTHNTFGISESPLQYSNQE